MRTPTRISSPSPTPVSRPQSDTATTGDPDGPTGDTRKLDMVNPYADLAALADPEPEPEPEWGSGSLDAADAPRRRTYLNERDDSDDPLGLGLRSDDETDGEAWKPPNHRRKKRGLSRFAAIPFALKLLVTALVGVSFLGLFDRFAVLYAQNAAAKKVKDALHLNATPEVDIEGFPFLTQVLGKHVDQVKVTIPDLAADRVSLAKFEATANDVRLDGDLPSSIKGATIGKMHGSVLLAFDDMNRELGASQVKFSEMGPNSVRAVGQLPIAGHDLRVRAEARIQRAGDRGISTDISRMRLDIGDIAVYRPGTGKEEGLRLTRKTAAELSRQAAKVKAMLGIPAIVDRIGIPKAYIQEALQNEEKLHELTGSPRFVQHLMKVNLVDVVADHPWLLQKVGIDPKILGTLTGLTKPQLADRLSLSFQLPKTPGNVRLQHISVERDGIRADLSGSNLPFGDAAKKPAEKK
ncbi:LmeA family phospholipid-binding protein [Streptomyces sp. CA2R101]|uniref:LmeA family phospholipid-binding protein n=1 Tax=Streptomyces sp. CA2R101 TaxID=3120152 RepID=UPI003FA6F17F